VGLGIRSTETPTYECALVGRRYISRGSGIIHMHAVGIGRTAFCFYRAGRESFMCVLVGVIHVCVGWPCCMISHDRLRHERGGQLSASTVGRPSLSRGSGTIHMHAGWNRKDSFLLLSRGPGIIHGHPGGGRSTTNVKGVWDGLRGGKHLRRANRGSGRVQAEVTRPVCTTIGWPGPAPTAFQPYPNHNHII
jgi:hypothetical protein